MEVKKDKEKDILEEVRVKPEKEEKEIEEKLKRETYDKSKIKI